MISRRNRLLLPTIIATTALAVAGCGGNDGGGGGGNEADYVKTYEAACKSFVAATGDFQKSATSISASAAKDPAKAVTTLKDGATKLFDTFGATIKAFAGAKAPDKFADFQKSVEDSSGAAIKGIDSVKADIAKIKSIDEFTTIGEKFQKLDIGKTKDLPKELSEKAPSCKAFAAS